MDKNNFEKFDEFLNALMDIRMKNGIIDAIKTNDNIDNNTKNFQIKIIETINQIAIKHGISFVEMFEILTEISTIMGEY